MSFVKNLFKPKIKASKQDYRFSQQTTKLVGKPLSVLYGTSLLRGNVVRNKTSADFKKNDVIVALCWGPVTYDLRSARVNGKVPNGLVGQDTQGDDQINVLAFFSAGRLNQPLYNEHGVERSSGDPVYGLNRVAYARITGSAGETFSGFDQVEVMASRPALFVSSGLGTDYSTPLPNAIKTAFPSGVRSDNPIAAALDYLLNDEYGPGKPASAFGDFSTWIAAIQHSNELVDLPDGSTEPRHVIGQEVGGNEGDAHADIVELLLELGDAKVFESGGVIKVWQARGGLTPVAALTRDDFEPDGFSVADINQQPNLVEVVYEDDVDGQKQQVTWSNPDSITDNGEIRKSYDYIGISSRTMASRKARLIGRRALAEAVKVEGKAHHKYWRLEAGDLITVTAGDETGNWVENQAFWVDSIDRLTGDSEFGVKLGLVIYGGDELYDDGHASELEKNDPVDDRLVRESGLPDPRGTPGFVTDAAAEVSQFEDQDGRVAYAVTLTWNEADEPRYMHDSYEIYRRRSVSDAWKLIGTSASVAYRDVGAPISTGDLYYAIVALTSTGQRGVIPSLYSVHVDRIRGPAAVDDAHIVITPGNKLSSVAGLIFYLDVSWQAVVGAVGYQLYYRYNGGPNILVDETTGTSLRIDDASPGEYLITLVAIGSNGLPSLQTSVSYVLDDDAYDGPEAVLNLHVVAPSGTPDGEFVGRDCEIAWDAPPSAAFDNPRFAGYYVEVMFGADVVREITTVDTGYTYTYDTNIQDSYVFNDHNYATRSITFRVRTYDRELRLSPPQQITATNPQAPVPSSVEVSTAFRVALITVEWPAGVSDIEGQIVKIGDSTSFDPASATTVGESGDVVTSITTTPGVTKYIKVALYDGFGQDSLNWTPAYAVAASRLVEDDIQDGAIKAQHLADDIFAGIETRLPTNGITVVSSLPTLPDSAWQEGRHAYLLADGKVYKVSPGGATWTKAIDGGDIKAGTILAGAIAAGVISADKLAANAITAKALAIGDFSNIVQNPVFATGMEGWVVWDDFADSPLIMFNNDDPQFSGIPWYPPASHVLRVKAGATAGGIAWLGDNYSKAIQAQPGEQFFMSAWVSSWSTSRDWALVATWMDIASSLSYSVSSNVSTTPGSWSYIETVFTVPSTARRVYFGAKIQSKSGAGKTDHFITMIRVRKVMDSVLIEDGAITAAKVTAGAITTAKLAAEAIVADKLAAGAVTAGKIAANAVTASTIAAGAITTDKLGANAVTAAKLAAGAIDANSITARSITTDKISIGGVQTNNIQNNAVSVLQDSTVGSQTSEGSNESRTLVVDLITFTTSAAGSGRVILTICSQSTAQPYVARAYARGGVQSTTVKLRANVRRSDGTALVGENFDQNLAGDSELKLPGSLSIVDAPGAGVTVTYQVYTYAFCDNSGNRLVSCKVPTLLAYVQELKR